jgi:hypothetical protein
MASQNVKELTDANFDPHARRFLGGLVRPL